MRGSAAGRQSSNIYGRLPLSRALLSARGWPTGLKYLRPSSSLTRTLSLRHEQRRSKQNKEMYMMTDYKQLKYHLSCQWTLKPHSFNIAYDKSKETERSANIAFG